MALLEIDDLHVGYHEDDGVVTAVDDVSLSVDLDDTVGIVGESGCGKSTLIKSIVGILDRNGSILSGSIRLKEMDLAHMSEEELNVHVRWKEISYIPQDAMAALNPVHQLGTQIVEVIRAHTDQSKKTARERTKEILRNVGLDADVMYDYPHELSGGQRQRGVIALALALEPSVILADEPTTGLDVVVQDEILQLLVDIQTDLSCAIILVTHDMSVVADIADKTVVMYGAKVMETGRTTDVFKRSTHPYTIGLKNAFPDLQRKTDDTRLIDIPGNPPSLRDPPGGCRFTSRCPFSTDECTTEDPPLTAVGDDHYAKCLYTDEAAEFRRRGERPETWAGERAVE